MAEPFGKFEMTPQTVSHIPAPGSTQQSTVAPPSSEPPPIPTSRQIAVAVLPQFEQRTLDAFRLFEEAKRALIKARNELAACQAIAAGEFDDAGTYAVGSRGAWRVEP